MKKTKLMASVPEVVKGLNALIDIVEDLELSVDFLNKKIKKLEAVKDKKDKKETTKAEKTKKDEVKKAVEPKAPVEVTAPEPVVEKTTEVAGEVTEPEVTTEGGETDEVK